MSSSAHHHRPHHDPALDPTEEAIEETVSAAEEGLTLWPRLILQGFFTVFAYLGEIMALLGQTVTALRGGGEFRRCFAADVHYWRRYRSYRHDDGWLLRRGTGPV